MSDVACDLGSPPSAFPAMEGSMGEGEQPDARQPHQRAEAGLETTVPCTSTFQGHQDLERAEPQRYAANLECVSGPQPVLNALVRSSHHLLCKEEDAKVRKRQKTFNGPHTHGPLNSSFPRRPSGQELPAPAFGQNYQGSSLDPRTGSHHDGIRIARTMDYNRVHPGALALHSSTSASEQPEPSLDYSLQDGSKCTVRNSSTTQGSRSARVTVEQSSNTHGSRSIGLHTDHSSSIQGSRVMGLVGDRSNSSQGNRVTALQADHSSSIHDSWVTGLQTDHSSSIQGSRVTGPQADHSSIQGSRVTGPHADHSSIQGSRVTGPKADHSSIQGSRVTGSKADHSSIQGSRVTGPKADHSSSIHGSSVTGPQADSSSILGSRLTGLQADHSSSRVISLKVDHSSSIQGSRVTALYAELVKELEAQVTELQKQLASRDEASAQQDRRIKQLEQENQHLKCQMRTLEEQNDLLSSRNEEAARIGRARMLLSTGNGCVDVTESNIQFLKSLVGFLETSAGPQVNGGPPLPPLVPAPEQKIPPAEIRAPPFLPSAPRGEQKPAPTELREPSPVGMLRVSGVTGGFQYWMNAEESLSSPAAPNESCSLWEETLQETLPDGTPAWASPVEENGRPKLELILNSGVYITHHQLDDLSQICTDKPKLMTRRLLDYFFSRETLARSSATGQRIAHNNTTMEKPIRLPVAVVSAIKEYVTNVCGRGCNFNAVINSKCGTSRRAVKKMSIRIDWLEAGGHQCPRTEDIPEGPISPCGRGTVVPQNSGPHQGSTLTIDDPEYS